MNKAYTLHDYCTITQKELQTIPYINEIIETGHAAELVLVNEALQERQIAKIADDIARRSKVRIVLIAGPSSSGGPLDRQLVCEPRPDTRR